MDIASIFQITTVVLLGFCIGSFLNVLIDRLPQGKSVIHGRSLCDFCQRTLRWYELIPILSYIFQKGMCLRCKRKLSLQYPCIEMTTGIFFGVITYHTIDTSIISLVGSLLLFCALLSIVVTDFKYYIIPDILVITAIFAVCMIVPPDRLFEHLIAGVGASVFFFLLWVITKGKGMGFGDVKLAFPLGLFHGPVNTILAFYIAFLTGAIVGVILMMQGKKGLKSKIPFGPFMVLGSVAVLLFGTPILTWWKGLI